VLKNAPERVFQQFRSRKINCLAGLRNALRALLDTLLVFTATPASSWLGNFARNRRP
jgi:hypothetical protein